MEWLPWHQHRALREGCPVSRHSLFYLTSSTVLIGLGSNIFVNYIFPKILHLDITFRYQSTQSSLKSFQPHGSPLWNMDSLRHTHSSVWGWRKGQITELLSTYISIWGIRIWVPLAHLFIHAPGHDYSFLYFPWIFLFFLCSTLNWQEHLSSDSYFLFHSKCMD